jgi:hypothetical protein
VVFRYPEDSPWYEHFTGSVLRHWADDIYGKSVASGEPKGIVILSLSRIALGTERALVASDKEEE